MLDKELSYQYNSFSALRSLLFFLLTFTMLAVIFGILHYKDAILIAHAYYIVIEWRKSQGGRTLKRKDNSLIYKTWSQGIFFNGVFPIIQIFFTAKSVNCPLNWFIDHVCSVVQCTCFYHKTIFSRFFT